MKLDLKATADFLTETVRVQGELALSRWESVGARTYKNRRDFATDVDLELEDNIKSRLRSLFPGHGLSGEESVDENPDSEYQWLIDPIDGTKYYADQSSLFAVSVGLLRQGRPILGAIYAPASKQCFHAYEGGGAYLDGLVLRGPRTRQLSECIINVDSPGTDLLLR